MNRLDIYEQSDCCCTTPVKTLVSFEHLITAVSRDGRLNLQRHELEESIEDFIKHPLIFNQLLQAGNAALPIALFNGELVKSGDYLTEMELEKLLK